MDAASLLDLPAGSEAARPGLVTRSVTGSSWPGQLPGVGPWRHPGRGLGHAGSRRRQHEEIVDGDAGRTAPVFHLSRSTASKLTILLQPCLSRPASGDRPKLDPHPPSDRPGLRDTSHLKAAACPAKPSSVSQAAGAAIIDHNLPHGGQAYRYRWFSCHPRSTRSSDRQRTVGETFGRSPRAYVRRNGAIRYSCVVHTSGPCGHRASAARARSAWRRSCPHRYGRRTRTSSPRRP
jgi:hypothetical protein